MRALRIFERFRLAIHEWLCQSLLTERHVVLTQRIEILLAECLALCQWLLLDRGDAVIHLRILLVNRLLWLCDAHSLALQCLTINRSRLAHRFTALFVIYNHYYSTV